MTADALQSSRMCSVPVNSRPVLSSVLRDHHSHIRDDIVDWATDRNDWPQALWVACFRNEVVCSDLGLRHTHKYCPDNCHDDGEQSLRSGIL